MTQSPGQVVGVTTFLAVLAMVAIVLRFCARRLKKVGLGWDDYSIVLAMVSWLALASLRILISIKCSWNDLDIGFHHRHYNLYLYWSCRRRPWKTRRIRCPR